jgi:hypothetical protein
MHTYCHLCTPPPPPLHRTMMVVTLYFTNDFTQPIYKFLTFNGGGGGELTIAAFAVIGKARCFYLRTRSLIFARIVSTNVHIVITYTLVVKIVVYMYAKGLKMAIL